MNKTLKGFLTGVLITVLWFVFYTNIPYGPPVKSADSYLTLRKLNSAMRVIRSRYDGEIDEQKIADYLFLGIVSALDDPYAAYYTKEEYRSVSEIKEGYYTGIGVSITAREEDGVIVIRDVTKDGPAERAGVLPLDEVVVLDGVETGGMTTSEVVELIQGSEAKEVYMTIYRPSTGETLEFTIVKESLQSQSVFGEMLEDNIGLIRITTFTSVTDDQFRETLGWMMEEGMEGLIIDLRNNLGGLVSGVCDTLRQILPQGVIVSTVDKYGNTSEKMCDGKNELKIPLAVLVNGKTASSSEIFAGAVKDYEMGAVIGTVTYGKGIVQDVFELSDGSVIKLTVSHYYTPKGNDIHQKGITPDIVVENEEDSDTDAQMDKAIEYIKEQVSSVEDT